MQIAVKRILAVLAAVGNVDIRPAVAVEINNRNRGTHGCHLRHDVVQLGIECRTFVDEIDSRRVRNFLEVETVAIQRGLRVELRFRSRAATLREISSTTSFSRSPAGE